MANYEELTVDGYIFATPKDAELAKNEIRKISYLENHADMTNVSMAKSVYEKALEERYFQTPIGLEYLRDLQKVMESAGVPEDEIKPIPLYTTFSRINLNEKETVKTRVTKQQQKELSLKQKYRNAVLIAVIFGILCFAMFFIVMNGSTPNVLNYKRAITNEYAAWNQELTEREEAVRQREIELNINN